MSNLKIGGSKSTRKMLREIAVSNGILDETPKTGNTKKKGNGIALNQEALHK